jgi:DNA-binding NarL/FixJ family response regulator
MKILMGDDHPLFREGLQRLLESIFPEANYEHASTFDELLHRCQDDRPVDLILTDLHMPGWPGFGGLAVLRAAQPQARLVVVSVAEDHANIRGALEHGASGFIPKSLSAPIMIGALELVLSGGIYLPPTMILPDHSVSQPQPRQQRPSASLALPHRSPAEVLTHRQREVLDRLCDGKSNKQIAYELGLSEGTVKIHITAIFRSLGVKNRTQAVISARQSAA